MKNLTDTIVALATPPMQGALAIIRVSGKFAFSIVEKISAKKIVVKDQNAIIHTFLVDENKKIDEVLLFAYKGPHSFTGEDSVEISCHGGMVVVNEILTALIKNGARPAERGEYSERAFYNGKIDLLQAESINDLIIARDKDAAGVALSGVNGEMSRKIKELKEELLALLSAIEVNIDYPEYDDIEQLTAKTLRPRISELYEKSRKIFDEAIIGETIKNGINVAIIGKPNVGKSSILNALIKEDKAIVSDIEGTTRDVVEGTARIAGLTFNFLDTAGIRKNAGVIENIGIRKTNETIKNADLILLISENKGVLDADEEEMIKLCADKKVIVVFNKIDVSHLNEKDKIMVSVKENKIQPLIDEMVKVVGFKMEDYKNKPLLSNARQKGLIEKVCVNLQDALKLCGELQPSDIVEIDVKAAFDAVQELLGEVYRENLSEEIFKRFCLGK